MTNKIEEFLVFFNLNSPQVLFTCMEEIQGIDP